MHTRIQIRYSLIHMYVRHFASQFSGIPQSTVCPYGSGLRGLYELELGPKWLIRLLYTNESRSIYGRKMYV